VGACRYPPAGFRSFGPIRAGLADPLGYVTAGAETAAAIAMIETAQALDRVDEIAATPGLDGLYIGPSDLSISLGLADVGNFANPALRAALERVLAAAARHGVVPGCHATSPADAALLLGLGFRLVSPASDSALLVAAARAALEQARG
jgi:4-hydroxy-2-oxoheptanedioate aldolase